MKKINIEDREYELIKNYNDNYGKDMNMNKIKAVLHNKVLTEMVKDNDYDYIVGDFSYDKLRLKGFYDEKNKNVTKTNNIKDLDKYIEEYCSYNARHFVLKKRKKSE